LHYQLIGSDFGFILLSKSLTLNDLERSSTALSPFCGVFFLRKRPVSELTTPNWLNIRDSTQKFRAKILVSGGYNISRYSQNLPGTNAFSRGTRVSRSVIIAASEHAH